MDKMKSMLEDQQKVNEAVKGITDYFLEVTYEDELELMFSAQTQIIGLMELAKQQMIITKGRDELNVVTNDLTTFMQVVNVYLHLLKPFAKMVE